MFLFLLVISHLSLKSQFVSKGGNISANEIWSDTVKVTSDITIENGVILTISAGCVVEFQDHYSFNVQGKVVAEAAKNNRIIFRAKDTVLTSSSGGWQGIRFDNTDTANDTSRFSYCKFFHGNAYGLDWFDQQGGAFAFRDFDKALIKNTVFKYGKATGNNAIIYVRNSSPSLLGNLIANNVASAIELSNAANPLIINNTIVNNTGYGINRNSYTPVVKNCILISNKAGNLREFSNQGNYISYSNIKNSGFNNNGNIDDNPEFKDLYSQNYELQNISPCIDAGSLTEEHYGLEFDILGNVRVFEGQRDTIVDMGAYEVTEEQVPLFQVNPDTLYFDSLMIGESRLLQIAVANNEAYPITVSKISSLSDNFIVHNFETLTIDTSEQKVYMIEFKPNTVAEYQSYIAIESNYRKQNFDSVVLIGKGLDAPTFVVNASKIEEVLNCTTFVESNFTIQNQGTGVLYYNIPSEIADNFENDLGQWKITGSWGLEFDEQRASNVLSERPGDNYQPNADMHIEIKNKMFVFDPKNCALSYSLKTEMENCCDFFNTEFKINDSNWQILDSRNGYLDWASYVFDLSTYVSQGDSLAIRFSFSSDNSNNFPGIKVDNFLLTGSGSEYLTFNKTNGAINPGDSDEITINFDANGYEGAMYDTKFKIESNDPLKQDDTISMVYNLNRFSTCEIINQQIVFDTIDVLNHDTLPLFITNFGCDTLLIKKCFTTSSYFSVDSILALKVAPNDTLALQVVFNPTDSLLYLDKVNLVLDSENNDTILVDISGKGNNYPIFSISQNVIDTTLFCDEIVINKTTIKNTGTDTLLYMIPGNFNDTFNNELANWVSSGNWGTIYDEEIQSMVLSDSPSGDYSGSSTNSISLENKFFIFDAEQSALSFKIKYDIETCCDSLQLAIKVNQKPWQVIATFTGISNWMDYKYDLAPIVSSGDSVNFKFFLATDGAVNKDGLSLDDFQIMGSGLGIVSINKTNGVLLPGESDVIELSFDANQFNISNIKTNFSINSNEPFQNVDIISCNYNINKYSTINVLYDSLIFDQTTVLITDTLACFYENFGCDTLKINSLVSNSNVFSVVSSTLLDIAPGDTGFFNIVFEPQDSLNYEGVLTIGNNSLANKVSKVFVSGKGKPYATAYLNTYFIDTTIYCGRSVSTFVNVTNKGNDTLQYQLPANFMDDFSDGVANWKLNGDWQIVYDSTLNLNCITDSKLGDYTGNEEKHFELAQALKINDASSCDLNYWLKFDIEECCDFIYTDIKVNNGSWQQLQKLSGKQAWQNFNLPLSNYLTDNDSLLIRFRFKTDFTNFADGVYIADINVTGIGSEELLLSKSQGTVSPGETDTIEVIFHSTYQYRNKYQESIIITTNNPLNMLDTLWFSYNIDKMGSLNQVQSEVEFGNVDVMTREYVPFDFYNIGCDTLFISDVFTGNSVFLVDSGYSKFVLPDDTATIKVLFQPTDSIFYSDYLTVVHSGLYADTTLIQISGTGNPYPILQIVKGSIKETQLCGTERSFEYELSNLGTTPLNYYIPVDFVEDFEKGIQKWEVSGNWDTLRNVSTGSAVLTDSPLGNYLNSDESSITLKNGILILNEAECVLSYDISHELENCCDYLITEIQVNNENWIELEKVNNTVDWATLSFQLSEYVEHNDLLKVRFRLTSDIQNNFDGVLIDNIKITGSSAHNTQLTTNRGTIQPNEIKTIRLDSRIALATLTSETGILYLYTNDPYNSLDSLSYTITNDHNGIDIFHGGGREGAVSFVLDSNVFVALGKNNDGLLNDVWMFDPNADLWVQKNNFPGGHRINASSFVLNGNAYIGLGYDATTNQNYKDFYRYNAITDSWTQIAYYPGKARSAAVSFVQTNKAYVGTGVNYGIDTTYFNDFWAYIPDSNSWDSVMVMDTVERAGTVAFSVYNKCYVAGGFNAKLGVLTDLWEYLPDSNLWSNKQVENSNIASFYKTKAICVGNKAIVSYGNSSNIYTYHPQSNSLINVGDNLVLGKIRSQGISFIYMNKAYFGLGKAIGIEDNTNPYPYLIKQIDIPFTHSPTGINLSKNQVDEINEGVNLVGKLSTDDKTFNDQFEYSIVDSNKYFYIDGSRLMAKDIDYEQIKETKLVVKSTDNEQNYFEQAFEVFVNDIPECPIDLTLLKDTIKTNLPVGSLVGTFIVDDQDTLDTHTLAINYKDGPLDSYFYNIDGFKLVTKLEITKNDRPHRFFVEVTDSFGLSNIFKVVVNIIEGVGINQIQKSDDLFNIYPNPANNQLKIKALNINYEVQELTLLSMNGDIVIHKTYNSNNLPIIELDVSILEKGAYLLLIKTSNEEYYRKVMIE